MAAIKQLLGLGWSAIKTWGPGLARETKSGAKFVLTHPKDSFLVGGAAVGIANGDGALRTWANWLTPGSRKDPLADKLNKTINGDKAKGGNILGDTLDSVAGDGTSQAIADGVRTVKDGAISTVDAAHSFVSNHMPSMPTMNQYADQQIVAQGQYPMQYAGQYPVQQGGGMSLSDFSPFSGFKSMLNTVTGGNTNLMSVAAMIPAAMLMFGNFGWMGKIASLMLGSMAVKNINHPSVLQSQPLQMQPQIMQDRLQQNYQLALADNGTGHGHREDDDHVIMRR